MKRSNAETSTREDPGIPREDAKVKAGGNFAESKRVERNDRLRFTDFTIKTTIRAEGRFEGRFVGIRRENVKRDINGKREKDSRISESWNFSAIIFE